FQYIADQHKTVYYNGNGEMQYGQQHINGKWYLFDKNSGARKTGFQYIADQHKTVYYNGNGEMQYGQQHINGKWYLFDKNSGARKTGFQYIADQHKTVYYNGNGEMQYGWQTVNGKKYFFDKASGSMYTGTRSIDGKNYNFASNGVLQDDTRQKVASIAKSLQGTPYVWGGTTPSGFDCSGFTQYVYKQAGINIGRTTYQQRYAGQRISVSQAKVGDLLMFAGDSHVAISLGNGKYVHAPTPGQRVTVASVAYYAPSYAVRVINS
ncbi:MAG: NlpC/P60 family protein, partial [Ligilactobacillus sp.]|nr:NlpC/P60 family protein [Ligilactobacillus sp.]